MAHKPLDVPGEISGIPVIQSGTQRQGYGAHITIGWIDVTPGNSFGYDWEWSVRGYQPIFGGAHGDNPDLDKYDEEHPYDVEFYFYWGIIEEIRIDANTGSPWLHDESLAKLRAVLPPLAARLAEISASNPNNWVAECQDPDRETHVYGRWLTEEGAAGWLAEHMRKLSKDRNLGEERQGQAEANAEHITVGARRVSIGRKVYVVRTR